MPVIYLDRSVEPHKGSSFFAKITQAIMRSYPPETKDITMAQPTMNDILNMTPEQKKELERKAQRQILTFVAIKVGVTVGTVLAVKALARHLEKIEQKASK
jgi:hypothetical protein